MVSNLKSITNVCNVNREKYEIVIRNYKQSDYQSTLDILRELHDLYDIGLRKQNWKPTSGLRQFKPNLKRETLVVELKSTHQVIGMGMIEASRNLFGQYTGFLENWVIKKEYIGKNIGKNLADRAIQILKSWGCKSIRINLGYTVPEKLLEVFKPMGFNPILIVLEKRIKEKRNF